jgi:hypothetical protein
MGAQADKVIIDTSVIECSRLKKSGFIARQNKDERF